MSWIYHASAFIAHPIFSSVMALFFSGIASGLGSGFALVCSAWRRKSESIGLFAIGACLIIAVLGCTRAKPPKTTAISESAQLLDCRERLGMAELGEASAQAALTECRADIHYEESDRAGD